METSPNRPSEQPAKKMRWLGFLMFTGGGVVGYLCIISPLIAASRHESDVSISPKRVVLGPALIVVGLILFFMGNEKAGRMLGTRGKPSALGLVICFVTIGLGILIYEWLKSRLRAYGYDV